MAADRWMQGQVYPEGELVEYLRQLALRAGRGVSAAIDVSGRPGPAPTPNYGSIGRGRSYPEGDAIAALMGGLGGFNRFLSRHSGSGEPVAARYWRSATEPGWRSTIRRQPPVDAVTAPDAGPIRTQEDAIAAIQSYMGNDAPDTGPAPVGRAAMLPLILDQIGRIPWRRGPRQKPRPVGMGDLLAMGGQSLPTPEIPGGPILDEGQYTPAQEPPDEGQYTPAQEPPDEGQYTLAQWPPLQPPRDKRDVIRFLRELDERGQLTADRLPPRTVIGSTPGGQIRYVTYPGEGGEKETFAWSVNSPEMKAAAERHRARVAAGEFPLAGRTLTLKEESDFKALAGEEATGEYEQAWQRIAAMRQQGYSEETIRRAQLYAEAKLRDAAAQTKYRGEQQAAADERKLKMLERELKLKQQYSTPDAVAEALDKVIKHQQSILGTAKDEAALEGAITKQNKTQQENAVLEEQVNAWVDEVAKMVEQAGAPVAEQQVVKYLRDNALGMYGTEEFGTRKFASAGEESYWRDIIQQAVSALRTKGYIE